jgi:hypothetical protein
MAKAEINSGKCGCTTKVQAESDDGQIVKLLYESDCPHVQKAVELLEKVDAYEMLSKKAHETAVYNALAEHIPHASCPVCAGILKTIEVAAGLALPEDAHIHLEK